MRGLRRLAAAPGRPAAAIAPAAAAYSTSSGGSGRGRGRDSSPPPRPPLPPRTPGQAESDADEDPFAPPGLGHGRGRPVLPSSPVLPAFSSWTSSLLPSSSAATGRGRGQSPPPPESAGRGRARTSPPPTSDDADDSQPKRPIFFKRGDFSAPPEQTHFADSEAAPLPRIMSPIHSGSGRGKPARPAEPAASEENRHLLPRAPIGAPRDGPEPAEQRTGRPRLDLEEAVRKAVEVLSRGGPGGGRGGGRGRGRGVAMRGRGRGGRFRGSRADEAAEGDGLYLGDGADGERLEKRLGEENLKKLTEEFEEMGWRALPSPLEDAYWDAVHTNNMV